MLVGAYMLSPHVHSLRLSNSAHSVCCVLPLVLLLQYLCFRMNLIITNIPLRQRQATIDINIFEAMSSSTITQFQPNGHQTSIMKWQNSSIINDFGKKYYVCPTFIGRLGNNMFQYAASYGIAFDNGKRLLIAKQSLIATYFQVDANMTEDALQQCSTFPVYTSPNWGIYNPPFSDGILKNDNIRTEGYFQSYKYFLQVKESIKKQFLSFKGRTKALNILDKIRKKFSVKEEMTNFSLIGVHIRRGDKVYANNRLAPKEYFIQAMGYFTSKYENPVFVVSSEDIKWARNAVPSYYNAVFLSQSSTPDIDLAILSMCDHIIISVGSYGWWAAYLNRGEVVYYKSWIISGSDLDKDFKHEDYYPPEWIPM
ncbi:hypothetical protein CHS0354_019481 [Potamilus streckersoni]|uniref:L-Fucosyltransferase n=1 Tax=Potamilus streckersoni TaxID=2493646 RepID=A0AAE0SHC5_9BIVA|nr:hypothetical protein CHS0354_019481 [Potamilus streckersoni]